MRPAGRAGAGRKPCASPDPRGGLRLWWADRRYHATAERECPTHLRFVIIPGGNAASIVGGWRRGCAPSLPRRFACMLRASARGRLWLGWWSPVGVVFPAALHPWLACLSTWQAGCCTPANVPGGVARRLSLCCSSSVLPFVTPRLLIQAHLPLTYPAILPAPATLPARQRAPVPLACYVRSFICSPCAVRNQPCWTPCLDSASSHAWRRPDRQAPPPQGVTPLLRDIARVKKMVGGTKVSLCGKVGLGGRAEIVTDRDGS
jgi:hypothetical protein